MVTHGLSARAGMSFLLHSHSCVIVLLSLENPQRAERKPTVAASLLMALIWQQCWAGERYVDVVVPVQTASHKARISVGVFLLILMVCGSQEKKELKKHLKAQESVSSVQKMERGFC